MRQACLFFMFFLMFNLCKSQVRDTVQRDIGVNLSWRSLAASYQSINSVPDVVRNLQIGVETRAWKFWIQTGIMIGWSRHRPINDEYNIDVFVTICYEFPIFRKRIVLGVGPIASYSHYYSKGVEWDGGSEVVESNLGSLGVNFEITVPIWKGLSLETCSDIGVGFNSNEVVPRIIRLASIGINYRFKCYPR